MSQTKKEALTSFSVVIGRFNFPHKGHLDLFRQALEVSENLIILIGSSFTPRTIKNPFSYDERVDMICSMLNSEGLMPYYDIRPLEDNMYDDDDWAMGVQNTVKEILVEELGEHSVSVLMPKITLVGYEKDESSFYLKMFPQWGRVEAGPYTIDNNLVSSTPLRSEYLDKSFNQVSTLIERYCHPKVVDKLVEYTQMDWFQQLRNEQAFINLYKKQFENAPYPPVFVTTDAVVIQSSHVLMVVRGAEPGKGLYALPGGFLGQSERIIDSMFRELTEETGIKVPEKILRKSVVAKKEFDHPNRSLRGRTITHAFLVKLEDVGSLPKVKGADDASDAMWIPLSEVLKMREYIYEDHLDIIKYFVGLLGKQIGQ